MMSQHDKYYERNVNLLTLHAFHCARVGSAWSRKQCLTHFKYAIHLFSQHMSFWRLFLDSHPTIQHTNTGVRLRSKTELFTCTL